MHPVSHESGNLLNISTGLLAQPNVNIDMALDIGTEELVKFEASWPEGFYSTLSK